MTSEERMATFKRTLKQYSRVSEQLCCVSETTARHDLLKRQARIEKELERMYYSEQENSAM
jgi:hypothetical protein